jgi:hypothetical protein
MYQKVFQQFENKTFDYYTGEINALYDAFDKYHFSGKTVMIWGLAGCNCEALALYKGAEKVYVIDYNKPMCDHGRIVVLSHKELRESDIKTDYSISFSSFEHDGLGQYGDPLDPEGDLRAMKEARLHLKEDGLLFLGVGISKDCLVWNAHRIYGETRLPLLLKGWKPIDVFNSYGDVTPDFPFDMPLGALPQPLLVLQKISTDFLEDEKFLEMIKQISAESKSATVGTRAPRLLLRIIKLLYDYKKSHLADISAEKNLAGTP